MRVADIVLLYTDAEVADYVKLGFDPARLFATNNSLDQTAIQTHVENWPFERLAEFRRNYGIANDKILLFCGRLTAKTDLSTAIYILSEVSTVCPDVKLVVIGEGAEREVFQREAEQLGINHRILWLGPIYEECDLAPWFLAATCFVYPGAIGLSLLHAMGYGLPVITHSDGKFHMPEFAALQNDVNSLTFRRFDRRDFSRQVTRLLSDAGLRARLSRSAKATVTETYTMENMVSRFATAIIAASNRSLGAE